MCNTQYSYEFKSSSVNKCFIRSVALSFCFSTIIFEGQLKTMHHIWLQIILIPKCETLMWMLFHIRFDLSYYLRSIQKVFFEVFCQTSAISKTLFRINFEQKQFSVLWILIRQAGVLLLQLGKWELPLFELVAEAVLNNWVWHLEHVQRIWKCLLQRVPRSGLNV